jgi:hypothetical protein
MNAFRSLIANIYSVADATALVYLFHELEYGLSLVGIASILPQLRLLIQQYFDIGGLRWFILRQSSFDFVHIREHGRPLKYGSHLLLPECSFNASYRYIVA